MTILSLSGLEYKDFQISIKAEKSPYTNRIEATAKLRRTDEELEKKREKVEEAYEDSELAAAAKQNVSIYKKKIKATEEMNSTLFGNTTIEHVEDAEYDVWQRVKEKIDEYWRDQAGDKVREEERGEE